MDNFISLENFKNSTNKFAKNNTPLSTSTIKYANTTNKTDSFENTAVLNNSYSAANKDMTSLAVKNELSNELLKAKKQNGVVEKVADKVKNLTGLGVGSKKIQKMIDEGANLESVKQQIHKYKSSQENTAQAIGDIASVAAGLGAMFATKQLINKGVAIPAINHIKPEKILDSLNLEKLNKSKVLSNLVNFAVNNYNKKATAITIGTIAGTLGAGLAKNITLKVDRIGSKKYKPVITDDMDKKQKKQAKKQALKDKNSEDRKNFLSGAVNGLASPILAVAGIAGVPIYAGINSLSRYFIANKEDKGNKSFSGYIENFKASPVINVASTVAIGAMAAKKANYNKIFEKNLNVVVEDLKNAKLTPLQNNKTTYGQLEEILFSDKAISDIVNDANLSTDEKIEKLSDKNIFALKFKQIRSDADPLTEALKQECPATRTPEAAKKIIEQAFNEKFSDIKCVGVGTVAESYLVKNSEGTEVCVKILKDGINVDKIEKDEAAFIEMIKNMSGKTDSEKEFLISNIKNIANGVKAEVDLNNEMEAAKKLALVTKKANVVKPIKVSQDGSAYMMEKADGITLADFTKFISDERKYGDKIARAELKQSALDDIAYQKSEVDKYSKTVQEYKDKLNEYHDSKKALDDFLVENPEFELNRTSILVEDTTKCDEYSKLKQKLDNVLLFYGDDKSIQSQIDNYTDILNHEIRRLNEVQKELNNINKYEELAAKISADDISRESATKLLKNYQDVIIEQFNQIGADGKIIHGDIHPGNIFIDFDKLKNGDKKFFTLIDTGNTIEQTSENAIRFLNLSKYVKNADIDNITEFVLEGAKLPDNMTKQKASEEISKRLYSILFDEKTQIGHVTNDNILAITDGIMQELKIIPADTQGNLMKSKNSAEISLSKFEINLEKYVEETLDKLEEEGRSKIEKAKAVGDFGKFVYSFSRKSIKAKLQETLNLIKMNPVKKAQLKKSKSTVATNSKEYLTYKLKQNKKFTQEQMERFNERFGTK